jgi:BlaI family penicillinase repressor
MTKKPIELFETEWAILKVVWKEEPCAAPSVQEALAEEKAWTYGTVKTLMDRMVKKGLLSVMKVRNLHLYSSAITQTQAQKSEITRAVKRAFDGTFSPLMHFLIQNDELSEQEYEELEALLKQRGR